MGRLSRHTYSFFQDYGGNVLTVVTTPHHLCYFCKTPTLPPLPLGVGPFLGPTNPPWPAGAAGLSILYTAGLKRALFASWRPPESYLWSVCPLFSWPKRLIASAFSNLPALPIDIATAALLHSPYSVSIIFRGQQRTVFVNPVYRSLLVKTRKKPGPQMASWGFFAQLFSYVEYTEKYF